MRTVALTVALGAMCSPFILATLDSRGSPSYEPKLLPALGILGTTVYVPALLGFAAAALRSPVLRLNEAGLRASTPWQDFRERSGRRSKRVTQLLWRELASLELQIQLRQNEDLVVGFIVGSPVGQVSIGVRYPWGAEMLDAVMTRRPDLLLDDATREVLAIFRSSRSSFVVEELLRRALRKYARERGLWQGPRGGAWFRSVRRRPDLQRDFRVWLAGSLDIGSCAARRERAQ